MIIRVLTCSKLFSHVTISCKNGRIQSLHTLRKLAGRRLDRPRQRGAAGRPAWPQRAAPAPSAADQTARATSGWRAARPAERRIRRGDPLRPGSSRRLLAGRCADTFIDHPCEQYIIQLREMGGLEAIGPPRISLAPGGGGQNRQEKGARRGEGAASPRPFACF